MNDCQTCKGERWVCEGHMDKPWTDAEGMGGCMCAPGVPCPACNPWDENTPPAMPPGFRAICSVDYGDVH